MDANVCQRLRLACVCDDPPDSAIFAIKATIGLLPAIFAALIAMIIFVKYLLNDEKFSQIRDETEARKLAAIKAHDEDADASLTPANAV